eukprot:15794825-Heterocapsa_arctica.AAC.1
MASDPKAKPSAAPKVSTELPAHIQRGKASERSRSAPIPRPAPPPAKAPPDQYGNFVPVAKAPPDRLGNLATTTAPSLMTTPRGMPKAKPLMAKPGAVQKARSTTPKPGHVVRRDMARDFGSTL